MIHEPPKVPSKSAREIMTETTPHCIDDHLVYVERERERGVDGEVGEEWQQENWVRRLMLSG